MKRLVFGVHLTTLALLSTTGSRAHADTVVTQMPAHRSERFSFTANARYDEVFPLFGALKEKVWAVGWNPKFVWPSPAADCAGMVFSISHEGRDVTWVNTVFDSSTGRVQYAYVVPDVMVTLITVAVRDRGATTDVQVQYDRTSLSPDGDELVSDMASHDRRAGPEWADQINAYLGRGTEPHP